MDASAAGPESEFELLVLDGPGRGDVISVPNGRVTVGSGERSQVRLTDPAIRPVHAELASQTDGFWIRDLTGSGGTLVNGEPVARSRLVDGSFVRMGSTELCVREKGKSGPYGTAIRPAVGGPNNRGGADPRSNLAGHAQTPGMVTPSGTLMRPATSPEAPSGEPSTVLPPGALIAGRYKVVFKLAEGGMGEVYKVEHIELGKAFAIKVMKPRFGADRDFVERFKREAVAAGRIGQQNIVDVSDFGRTEDGRFFFAMEFLDGPTLADVVREGPLPPSRALYILAQMCRALKAAHALGIVHRDLKPENVILLERDGQPDFVKVVDFGVAKVATNESTGKTSAGLVVGTPQYMSPEQASGLPLDLRSDIYSLGLIAFEMLTGRPPFEESTPSLIMAAHIYKPAPPLYPSPEADPVRNQLNALVAKMLAKPPDARPQTIQQALEGLESAWSQLDESGAGFDTIRTGPQRRMPHPTPRPSAPVAPLAAPRKSRAPLIAAAVAVLALGGAAGWWFTRSEPPAPIAPLPPMPTAAPSPPPPAPAPAPPAPAVVKLSLVSEPPNAEVRAGAEVIGRTPVMVDWPKGKHADLKFTLDGYQPTTRTVDPQVDTALGVTLSHTPATKPKRHAPAAGDDIKDNPFK